MLSSLVLIGCGLFVWVCSAILRELFPQPIIGRLSLSLGLIGVWIALHGDGVWATVWPLIPLIILIWFLPERFLQHKAMAPVFDLSLVALAGLTAVPRPEMLHLTGLVVAVALAGFSIDLIVSRVPKSLLIGGPALAIAAVLIAALMTPATLMGGYRLLESRLLVAGMASPFAQNQPVPTVGSSPIQTINEQVELEPAAVETVKEEGDAKLIDGSDSGAVSKEENTLSSEAKDEGDTFLPVMSQEATNGTPNEIVVARPIDVTFSNSSVSGNPFDVVADVAFEHAESGRRHQTQMFYMGGDEWRARFTASAEGEWSYTTTSEDSDLNGLSGTVTINREAELPGFVGSSGQKWVRTGENPAAFVPQFAMYSEPVHFYNNPAKLEADIANLMGEHGFTGLHVKVLCRWFDLDKNSCNDINLSDPNPDLRTFEAMEQLILEVYDQGGVVHIWVWGDESRGQTPQRWGYNQKVDQRLQRYIAARLGPLPGWTMGYGFDLFEWTNEEQLDTWYQYMHAHLGWHHMLGARSNKNELNQISEMMDYSGYEQHRPDYDKYVESLGTRPEKPTFSEDRFRVRNEGRPKDYSLEDTRRGLWRSGMSGGVANIWGYLQDSGSDELGSATYPNKNELKLYFDYFDPHYAGDLARCNDLTDGLCLKNPSNTNYIFYIEEAPWISVDLSEMDGPQSFLYVNTETGFTHTGTVNPTQQDIGFFIEGEGPVIGDWAVFIGEW